MNLLMINFTFDIHNIGIIVLLAISSLFLLLLLISSCNPRKKAILKDKETETDQIDIVEYDLNGYAKIDNHYIQYI